MTRRKQRLLFCALALAGLTCKEEQPAAPPPSPPVLLPDVGAALSYVYRNRDAAYLASIVADEPGAEFHFLLGPSTSPDDSVWTREEFIRLHRRLLDPEHLSPGDPPLPPEVWLQAVTLTLIQATSFEERHEVYSQDGGHDGKLDPQRWRATGARFSTYFLFELAGETDYRIEGESDFVLIEDLSKNRDDPSRFFLYRWEDRCGMAAKPPGGGRAVPTRCLGDFLGLFLE